jgi:hypothetical protein
MHPIDRAEPAAYPKRYAEIRLFATGELPLPKDLRESGVNVLIETDHPADIIKCWGLDSLN